ncbi:MAG: YicC/YloC family endoribonuclease [Pseudomonadota bacterium]
MRSMTGYGQATTELGERRIVVDIRSVNSRIFDIKVRTPWADPILEERIIKAAKTRINRGAVTISLREEGERCGTAVHLDGALAASVASSLGALRDLLDLPDPVTIGLVASYPGVLVAGTSPLDAEKAWPTLAMAVDGALAALLAMRDREGGELGEDLRRRFSLIKELADRIEMVASTVPEQVQRRLRERIGKLLANLSMGVDELRLANEIATIAERTDITEELTRLRSHLVQAEATMNESGPLGRKLDFLAQEIGRELNTISAKAQLPGTVSLAVEARAEVEKIREQAQNLE